WAPCSQFLPFSLLGSVHSSAVRLHKPTQLHLVVPCLRLPRSGSQVLESLRGANCEVTFDGKAFTDWPCGDIGEITLRTTVDAHHFLVLCR
ncbi:MAG TPA: hypothetical protein VJU54_05680, partial [Nitrospiraceae bacterium]|nr:hypothetical protein [Nitrospiraceae bacterium]